MTFAMGDKSRKPSSSAPNLRSIGPPRHSNLAGRPLMVAKSYQRTRDAVGRMSLPLIAATWADTKPQKSPHTFTFTGHFRSRSMVEC
jgi:hypothetical protein